MIRGLASLGLAFAVAGCVHSYSEMLSSDTIAISANGSELRSRAAIMRAAMVEAAQQTLAHGYCCFLVLGMNEADQMSENPTFTMVTPSPEPGLPGLAHTYGGGISVRPGSDMTVRMVRSQVQGSYDARDVLGAGD